MGSSEGGEEVDDDNVVAVIVGNTVPRKLTVTTRAETNRTDELLNAPIKES